MLNDLRLFVYGSKCPFFLKSTLLNLFQIIVENLTTTILFKKSQFKTYDSKNGPQFHRVEEFWDPQQEGLEPIVATRNIPSIHILLSLEEIDPKTPGYQHSRARTTFWSEGDQTEGKSGRKNYFTGPQLKKKPNRHYENGGKDGGGTGANGGGPEGGAGGNGGGNKNKKKNKGKGGKPTEGGQTEVKEKKDSGEKVENKAKKAKNNENKQKAQSSGSGDAAPVGKEPAPGTSSES